MAGTGSAAVEIASAVLQLLGVPVTVSNIVVALTELWMLRIASEDRALAIRAEDRTYRVEGP